MGDRSQLLGRVKKTEDVEVAVQPGFEKVRSSGLSVVEGLGGCHGSGDGYSVGRN